MTQNSIDNRTSQLTIDPGASGDAYTQFNINTTGEFRIGVDDTDDSYRISQGSALGTNDTLVIEADGVRKWPLSSMAKFSNNTTRSNVTGDGTQYTMNFDTEGFDRNNNLSSATTFEAPVDGIYYIAGSIRLDGIISSHTDGVLEITGPSTAQSLQFLFNPFARLPSGGTLVMPISGLIDLLATNTIVMNITVDGGTKVVDSSAGVDSSFLGVYLVG